MLKYRLLSGFTIVAVLLLVALYAPPVVIWLLLLTISSVGQYEFYHMVNSGGIPAFRIAGILSGMALISATYWTAVSNPSRSAMATELEMMVLLISMIVICVRQFPQKNNDKPLATIACTLLGIWYVPFLFDYITRLAFAWDGAAQESTVGRTGLFLVMYLVLVVKITDIGAYFTGRMFGKHKLFPRVSPAKTWEGFVGGIVAAVAGSLIFCEFADYQLGKVLISLPHALVLGVLLALAGVVGDLFESLLKRASGVKDSSAFVPGMGGVLDVIDSLLFGAPILYYYARFILS